MVGTSDELSPTLDPLIPIFMARLEPALRAAGGGAAMQLPRLNTLPTMPTARRPLHMKRLVAWSPMTLGVHAGQAAFLR
jgi:hypothetical protein